MKADMRKSSLRRPILLREYFESKKHFLIAVAVTACLTCLVACGSLEATGDYSEKNDGRGAPSTTTNALVSKKDVEPSVINAIVQPITDEYNPSANQEQGEQDVPLSDSSEKEIVTEAKVTYECKKYSDGSYEKQSYEYDTNGRLLVFETEGSDVQDRCKIQYNYNIKGFLVSEHEKGFHYETVKKYEYDSKGNLIKCTEETESRTKDFTKIRTYQYDEKNRLVCEESENYIVNYEYDDNDNLVKEEYADSYFLYEYNNNQIIHETKYKTSTDADILDAEYFFYYDEMGMLIKKCKTYGTGEYVIEYIYKNGLLLQEITYNSSGEETSRDTYCYDNVGNITKITHESQGNLSYEITYSYRNFTYEKMG